jgi:hypothetical protein
VAPVIKVPKLVPALLVWASALPAGTALGADAPVSASPHRWLSFGVEGIASVATDDPGYFNDTSYRQSTMRLMRLRLLGSLRLGERAALLAEGRADNGEGVTLAALYLRARPFRDQAFDVQVGRIPPVFGAYPRRSYAIDNPLIGSPVIYQYLTSLRADALPATVDDLLVMKGRGWRTHYPVGSNAWDRGLPVIAGDRWDTGAEVRIGREPVSLSAAVTQGALSNPLVRDDNGGKQISGRLEVRPTIGLVLGASVSRGAYLSKAAAGAAAAEEADEPYTQDALGVDAEYSRGYWVLRAEGVASRWAVPDVRAPLVGSVEAWGGFIEARYKIRPGLYAAVRADRLAFSRLTGGLEGGRPTSWDAPVSRVEAGGGYSLRRYLILKVAVQHDWRSGVSVRSSETVVGAQALLWF